MTKSTQAILVASSAVGLTLMSIGLLNQFTKQRIQKETQAIYDEVAKVWISGGMNSDNVKPLYERIEILQRTAQETPWVVTRWPIVTAGICVLIQSGLIISIARKKSSS